MVHYLNAFSFDVTTSSGKTKQQTVAELARDSGVKTLVTTHHGPGIDREAVRLRILAEMQEIFKGTLIWGEDLMEFVIGDE